MNKEILKELYSSAISQEISTAMAKAVESHKVSPSITKLFREFREIAVQCIKQYCVWYATPDYETNLLNNEELVNELCDMLCDFALEGRTKEYSKNQ